jgi:hypothetical protein
VKTLIENTFALSTKLIKTNLQKARRKELVQGEYINFRHNGRPSALDYSIDYSFDENSYLVVTFDAEPQKILLVERGLTFGTRTYLVCPCGARTNALYLKQSFFACRNCQNLTYRSTTINTTSDHGRFFWQQGKRIKLMEMREEMDRIFYKSHYTKRFLRWLKLCEQSGLLKYVNDADITMNSINNNHSR